MIKLWPVLAAPAVAVAGALAPLACGSALAPGTADASPAAASAAHLPPRANSHWKLCNSTAVASAPKVLWRRIAAATQAHTAIPPSFWTRQAYRQDIVKIVCYESSFNYRAENDGWYGWYQMSKSLIESEGVTFEEYWDGNSSAPAGWYQCTAGELYISGTYGTPAAAWQHEEKYGWY